MEGRASAPGAGTVLNALATSVGSAFAIDVETRASVELDADADRVAGEVTGVPEADTSLVERCAELVVERFGDGEGGRVVTESDVPMSAGLKSSSAAANATVLATLDALDVPVGATGEVTRAEACRLGVRAARETGVTVTGAFDDASASMLGGLTVTDNADDALLARDKVDWDVLVWTPPETALSADADVGRCERIAPMARLVEELALDARYAEAMTVNGLAFSAALGFPTDPVVEALPHADGASLSGTGPSVVAVAARESVVDDDADGRSDEPLAPVKEAWDERPGATLSTTTRTEGARTE